MTCKNCETFKVTFLDTLFGINGDARTAEKTQTHFIANDQQFPCLPGDEAQDLMEHVGDMMNEAASWVPFSVSWE